MRNSITEILHVIPRNPVRISPQRRQRFAVYLRRKSPGIYLDVVEVVFAAEQVRVVVIDPALQKIATEFPMHAAVLVAYRLRNLQLVLIGVSRQGAGLSK